ncbi:hypothetical protein CTheo_9227 [Ceratobasidium theobromae]|uniref:Uncharacterized protein n=1 Tax=Ceratobasidium theobromae TaxID=1582974 RepID=A0A5N5Q7G1_9AGAM|nr:hypothetical protein CTheo_9227 [Ceratobasidium theobromae]
MTDLCNPDDRSLGIFKKGFIATPVDSGKNIAGLNNGWDQASGVVYRFAEFLNSSIYNKKSINHLDFLSLEKLPGTVVPMDEEDPWLDIKRVIDIFDRYICLLQAQP